MKFLVFNIPVLKLLFLAIPCTKFLSSKSEGKVLALPISILTPTKPIWPVSGEVRVAVHLNTVKREHLSIFYLLTVDVAEFSSSHIINTCQNILPFCF